MGHISNEKIKGAKENLEQIELVLDLLEECYDNIDSMNGNLCEIVELFPEFSLQGGEDTDIETITDFYTSLPSWSVMDDLRKSLIRIKGRIEIDSI